MYHVAEKGACVLCKTVIQHFRLAHEDLMIFPQYFYLLL